MNKTEHLLVILAEEGCELSQQVAKALRFGIHEQRDLPTSNRERMQAEFNDILAVVEMLNWQDGSIDLHRDNDLIEAKKRKVEKYLAYSKELGTFSDSDTSGFFESRADPDTDPTAKHQKADHE